MFYLENDKSKTDINSDMNSDTSLKPENRNDYKVWIETFGCRANKYDSSVLHADLASRGYDIVSSEEEADIVLINSCTVTSVANQAVRRYISQTKRQKPNSTLLLTGCYAEVEKDFIKNNLPIDIVAGNKEKDHIADMLDEHIGLDKVAYAKPMSTKYVEHKTRFFFKIQDGCNVCCSYCIIPSARGNSRSLPIDAVLSKLKDVYNDGYNEVILSGIHLGAYGRDIAGNTGLAGLVRRILDETGFPRIRFGSIEPWGIRPDFIKLFATEKRIMPSLHIPLQSGSDKILKLMKRPISTMQYKKMIDSLYEARPDFTLWIDVIAGFPGETDLDFRESFNFIQNLACAKLHVFPYSIRNGTPAASFENQVLEPIKKDRVQAYIELSDRCYLEKLQSKISKKTTILLESGKRGHTPDNFLVSLSDGDIDLSNELSDSLRGNIIDVDIVGVKGEKLVGIYNNSLYEEAV